MNLPATIFPILLALLIPSCESQEGSSKVRGKHQSSAMVSIHPSPILPETQNFLANQMVILTSEVMIDAAAEIFKIHSGTIEEALEVQQVEGTDFVRISAYHDEETVPRIIVEAILKAYSDHREQRVADRVMSGLKALEEEIGNQHKLVIETREALTSFIGNYGIPYSDGGSRPGPSGDGKVISAEGKRGEFESVRDEIAAQLETFEQLSGLDLIRYAAGLDHSGNEVARYYQEYLDRRAELDDKIAGGLGDAHPEVFQLREEANRRLEDSSAVLATFKEVLKTKVRILDRQIEKMSEMIRGEESGGGALNLKPGLNDYSTANDHYEQARDALAILKVREQEARILLNTPREVFTVHEWKDQ